MSPTMTLVYYTHNVLPDTLRDAVIRRLNTVAENVGAERMAIIAPLKDAMLSCAGWCWWPKDRSTEGGGTDQDERILYGCKEADTDLCALVEHDVLYPASYLQTAPLDQIAQGGWWYDANVVRMNQHGFFHGTDIVTSCMIARRDQIVEHFARRLEARAAGERIVWDEPGKDIESPHSPRKYIGRHPVIDVRWGGNMTGMREAKDGEYMVRLDGWPDHSELWRDIGKGK